MFEALGRAVVRGRWLVIAMWIALAAGMVFFAPSLAEVGTASDAAFLPKDAPSIIGQEAFRREFPDLATAGEGLIVVHNPHRLSSGDRGYAEQLVTWLGSQEAPAQVGQINSVFGQPELESVLVSKDETTMLVRLDFTSPPSSDATNQALTSIRDHIHTTRPQGLNVYFTGEAAITKDLLGSILNSVSQTTWVTVLLVVVVLLLIYHSPVAAGVPLVTIGIAFLITRGLLGILVETGVMRVSSMVEAFIVVLIFGAGTDYALFLISRYREEVARRPDHDRESADIQTVARIGPVITASASTVIIATMGMIVARFEMTRTQGPAMAMGIAIGLLASLTLTPALLSVFGKHLFWPFHERLGDRKETEPGRFWQRLAAIVTSRPGIVAATVTGLLLIPYLALPQLARSFDVLSELPRETESRQGFDILRQHFDQGEMLPVAVVLTSTRSLQSPAGLADIVGLQKTLAALPGVGTVRSVISPSGGEHPDVDRNMLAREQVLTLTAQLKQSFDNIDATSQSTENADPTAQLDGLQTYLGELAEAFPSVAQSAGYGNAQTALHDLKSSLTQSVQAMQVYTQLTNLAGQVGRLTTASSSGSTQQGQGSGQGLQNIQSYLTELGQAYPEVKTNAAFEKATTALGNLTQALAKQKEQAQVSTQLGLLAAQMAQMRQNVTTPQPGQTQPQEQVMVIGSYMQELAQAYPEVKSNPSYSDALTVTQQMQASIAQLAQARSAAGSTPTPQQLQQIQALSAQMLGASQNLETDLTALAATFAGRDATFSSRILSLTPQATQQRATLQQSISDLQVALTSLAEPFRDRDARFVPKNIPAGAEQEQRQAAISDTAKKLTGALDEIAAALPADAYFLPASLVKEQPGLGKLMDTFLSSNTRATQLQVLLTLDPYSEPALTAVDRIEAAASASADATDMMAYTTGPTAQVRDLHQIVNDDLPRVITVVVSGVFLVFVLLLRSLAAPIYLVATVLLSYGTTMGLITILFQGVLNEAGINYVIPTIILVLLVALGADYNIFLISRVWEEAGKDGSVRLAVRRASAFTGSVITSAGIILAGTFAALAISPIQTLSQVGTAVALGVLVDTFIVRAMLVPAIAALVGPYNWWPRKRPGGQGSTEQTRPGVFTPGTAPDPHSAHR